MIGVLIKYKGNSLFTELPKDTRELEDELAGIGLNVYPKAINLSNRNDFGYEIFMHRTLLIWRSLQG